MVKIKESIADDDNGNEEDSLWLLLKEIGGTSTMMETAVQDVDENVEFKDAETGLEDMVPSTDPIPCVILPLTASSTGQETDYVLYSKLRFDYVANKLQL